MKRFPSVCLIGMLLGVAVALPSCSDQAQPSFSRPTRHVATLFPTLAVLETTPLASPTEEPSGDSGWIAGPHGLALRRMQIHTVGEQSGFVVIVRVDPTAVQLHVGYTPDRPRSLRTWFVEEQPLLAINGGFFTEEYQSTALVISDGMASGSSYEGFGGMLAVAPDGEIWLQVLRDEPYIADQPLLQALQSFPMLVFPGGIPGNIEEDHQQARRTAVAFDQGGHLLFIVSPTRTFSLRSFGEWLAHSDLQIDRALNLDGGSSTGLYLQAGSLSEQIDSFSPLPSVLLIRAK